ncbi:phosphonate degradation HD-domain oxygenase [Mucilaginibacter sp. P25]|uniref:HDIG domain-containing protein n=2 Tax=Mucilaginibacter TaxID=423349 RepID=A0AAE6JNQ2_9SPHI|nr:MULTISPECIES: phosphonate degradation HD-domain oxygenase [Mucilaginibacter]QEM07952.1 HDIG domain-containing protein [Mucilaginibacter rubeus]QEM20403.1 HDIG domain-containing protein [Mucilaginibacter gossypii]QTE42874.1 HDIG domain-containing protein [Mucilaginibacter rubeus]QTE49475.1 HDIG domain-containing protein [Mucilaginibacter rubeus]QTE54571.1 HDIG domain-containing protein [Mucilaginibacter rubeus]
MVPSHYNPKAVVAEVFSLYEKFGDADYIGEPVSQLEHMSQAASLAEAEGYDDEVVLAAFFHDIGHLCADAEEAGSMDGMGNVDHERLGADYLLERGFSERVANLVQGHVIAKRYLTYKYPEYYNRLSDASKATLEFQGGVMTEAEAAEFELNQDAELIIRLRYWDDMAKEMHVPVNNLDHLKAIALAHLQVVNE